jgi:hypothetical protein
VLDHTGVSVVKVLIDGEPTWAQLGLENALLMAKMSFSLLEAKCRVEPSAPHFVVKNMYASCRNL